MTNKEIGRRIDAVRLLLEMRQNEFAAGAGVEANTYSNWKSGAKRPSVEQAMKLCNTYGMTLDYIFRGDVSGLPSRIAVKLHRAA